jgi:hypothetical protein
VEDSAHKGEQNASRYQASYHNDIIDKFANMAIMHPSVGKTLENELKSTGLRDLSCREFRALKHRILTVNEFLKGCENITDDVRQHATRYLDEGDEQSMKALSDSQKDPESKSIVMTLLSFFDKDTKKHVSTTTDSHFLASLNDIVAEEPLFQPSAEKALQRAQIHIREKAKKMLNKLTHTVQSISETACLDQIRREAAHNDEERRKHARKELIQGINKSSQASPSSYVIDYYFLRIYLTCESDVGWWLIHLKSTGRTPPVSNYVPPSLGYASKPNAQLATKLLVTMK